MPDDSTINFDVAEKYSYVYADEKFGKLAVTATGDAKLVDPLAWSYAETHSYVKVDPSSVGVEVPSGVTELYAKVIYAPGIGGGSGGSSSSPHTHKISDITNLNASLNSLSSSISVNSGNISSLSSYTQNEVISISNDISYLSSAIDGISFDSLISSITINSENISYLSSVIDELPLNELSGISRNAENIQILSSLFDSLPINLLSSDITVNSNRISYLSSAFDELSALYSNISFSCNCNLSTLVNENVLKIDYLSSALDELSVRIDNIKECHCDPQNIAYISGRIDDLQNQILEIQNGVQPGEPSEPDEPNDGEIGTWTGHLENFTGDYANLNGMTLKQFIYDEGHGEISGWYSSLPNEWKQNESVYYVKKQPGDSSAYNVNAWSLLSGKGNYDGFSIMLMENKCVADPTLNGDAMTIPSMPEPTGLFETQNVVWIKCNTYYDPESVDDYDATVTGTIRWHYNSEKESSSESENSPKISYLSSVIDDLSARIDNIKECHCDPQNIAYISGKIDDLQYQITEVNNDSIQSSQYILDSLSGYATKDDLDNIIIPTKVSELENDERYVPLSAVQQMIMSTVSSLNIRLAKLEATAPSGETNLGERDDELNTLEGDERVDGGDIIEYSDRVPANADDAGDDSDMALQELAEMYNQKIARLEAKIQDSVVDLGEHSDNLENLNIDERNATDSQSNGIIFGDRI